MARKLGRGLDDLLDDNDVDLPFLSAYGEASGEHIEGSLVATGPQDLHEAMARHMGGGHRWLDPAVVDVTLEFRVSGSSSCPGCHSDDFCTLAALKRHVKQACCGTGGGRAPSALARSLQRQVTRRKREERALGRAHTIPIIHPLHNLRHLLQLLLQPLLLQPNTPHLLSNLSEPQNPKFHLKIPS